LLGCKPPLQHPTSLLDLGRFWMNRSKIRWALARLFPANNNSAICWPSLLHFSYKLRRSAKPRSLVIDTVQKLTLSVMMNCISYDELRDWNPASGGALEECGRAVVITVVWLFGFLALPVINPCASLNGSPDVGGGLCSSLVAHLSFRSRHQPDAQWRGLNARSGSPR